MRMDLLADSGSEKEAGKQREKIGKRRFRCVDVGEVLEWWTVDGDFIQVHVCCLRRRGIQQTLQLGGRGLGSWDHDGRGRSNGVS